MRSSDKMAKYRSVNRLMAMFNDFQIQTKPNLSPSSFATSVACYEKFKELTPKLLVSQLRKSAKVREVYESIIKYPCYRTQKYNHLPLAKCYLEPDYEPININTAKIMFSYLKRVLAWAGKYNYVLDIDADIHLMIQLPKKEKTLIAETRGQFILPTSTKEKIGNVKKPVKSWTTLLLNKVFNTHIYTCQPNNRIKYTPLHFWLFPIAYCHGMRAREIAQLSVDDVVNIDGIYGFVINDSKPYQRVKNIESRRFVPIHQYVLDSMGFLDYLAWRTALETDSDLLFLTPVTKSFMGQDGLQNKVSRIIRLEANIAPRSGYNTHSFRHLFIDTLRGRGVPTWRIARIVGHDIKAHHSITDEYGSNQLSVEELQEVVNQFQLPVKIGHVSWEHFTYFVASPK